VKGFLWVCFLGGATFLCLERASALRAQELQQGQKIDPASLEWPRVYTTNGFDFAVYQPQITQWPSNFLEGRFVVAVRPSGTSNETYGVVFFKARTEIDKVNRLVTLEDFAMTKVNFPNAKEKQDQYIAMLKSFQKHSTKVIPLDHLEAVFAASANLTRAKAQNIKNDPPRIIYATQPSLLILVDGQPIAKPLVGEYERVINTRPVLLFNTNVFNQGYWLFAAERWYSASSLEGPWSVPESFPKSLQPALEAAIATKQVDVIPPKDPNAVPPFLKLYVSTVPTELVQTMGDPSLTPIPGTDLSYVSNSDNAIFYQSGYGQYYILISGRWFVSSSFYGPWAFVPPGKLPADFQRIPAHHPKSNVLASVPGTPQAQEALIANAIPQTATIDRSQANLTVDYQGAPEFTAIPGTSLTYAMNTGTPVIMVGPKSYYACHSGVWFSSSSSVGPWIAATSVPDIIYTIPPSCPIYYVTYAYVYGATPQQVYVGYTPGYAGTVVGPGGVVVYGTGYAYRPFIRGGAYVGYPPTYGYGAAIAVGPAVGFSFGFAAGASLGCWCEPHWGCYAAPYPYSYGHVNVNATSFYTSWGAAVHASGTYGYNPYTGASWGSQHAAAYNPYTGASASAGRGAAYNPYTGNAVAARGGSWDNPYTGASAQGRASGSANAYTGNYSGNRETSGYNPTTGRYESGQTSVSGNFRTGTASTSSSGTAGNTKTGNSVSWNNGNVYADANGNMYSYSGAGAQKYNTSTGSYQSASAESHDQSWADRAGAAQVEGSQRYDSWHSSGGGGWGGGRRR
jgi:hypothetical protein